METSLHRDLKRFYGGDDMQFEVPLGAHRIDVVAGGRLVEIQLASLAAIRDKVRALLKKHHVVVVKPIVARKTLVKRASKDGPIAERRDSPKRGAILDLFDELVHFTRVFPHERLTLEVPLLEIEEWRYPGHGRRRRWRRDDYEVEDQKLVSVGETYRLRTAADLAGLVSCDLPRRFHTGHLAESLGVPRWTAQQIAYCLPPVGRRVGGGQAGQHPSLRIRPRQKNRVAAFGKAGQGVGVAGALTPVSGGGGGEAGRRISASARFDSVSGETRRCCTSSLSLHA